MLRFRRRPRRLAVPIRIDTSVHPQDILSIPPLAAGLFWLPIFAIALTGYASVAPDLRVAVWTIACLTMAAGSAINAMRCGRLQCYSLTPLFLAGALASLAYGSGLIALGGVGWGIIGYGMLAGVVMLGSLPELFLGRYR